MASFWLEFDQGGHTQQVNFESESISIGRDRSSDFVLDHPTVSRQHALIVHQGQGRFQLVVLSRGGLTAVDGQQVQTSEVDLYDQAQLTFGQYTVRFRSHQAPQRPAGSAGMGSTGAMGQFGGGHQGNQFGSGPIGGGQQGNQFGSGPMGGGQQGNQFGSGPMGGGQFGGTPAPEPPKEEKKENAAGIMSWDEIAASSREDEEAEEADALSTDFQRIKSAKEEKSNPIIIVGALGLAVLVLGFALLSGGGGSGPGAGEHETFEDWPYVDLEVRCHDTASCQREAERQYELGIDLLERHAVETGNLFDGYVHLLKAQELLKQGGIEAIPDEMNEWQPSHDRARESLDRTFREQRMRFHQAAQRGRHSEMVGVLDEIQVHFPDRTARENRWARERERQMRAEGTYPRRR